MKLKHFVISAFLLSFVFLASHVVLAQDYVAPKFAVKLGYVKPTENGWSFSDSQAGAFGFSVSQSGGPKAGFGLGFEWYTASTPKSEIVIGMQYARLKYDADASMAVDFNGDGDLTDNGESASDSVSANFTWLHIPITYKFKFGQSEGKPGGLYLGAGPSVIISSKVLVQDVQTGDYMEASPGGSTFGFHLKGGYDFGKGAIDIEWSNAKKSSVDLGALGIFGVYKF